MTAGFVLVHGYTGSPDDLEPLAALLEERFGAGSISMVRLPGHGPGLTPCFDREALITSVQEAAARLRKQRRRVILIGHSTGGTVALAGLGRDSLSPDLLVLAAVPHRIDAGYLERWAHHRAGKTEVPFSSVAGMVSLINRTAEAKYEAPFPVIVLQGSRDELVPPGALEAWGSGAFQGPVRTAVVPGAGHDLFQGRNRALAIDLVARACADFLGGTTGEAKGASETITAVEPEAARFLSVSPLSAASLAASPSGRSAAGLAPVLSPGVGHEPVIANIEITTRCNLRCAYCARTLRGSSGEDMTLPAFKTVLGLLPHAYRVTLVGLGETLLHPRAAEFVAEASSRGRRVALVTNAMLLDEELSRKLLRAGLESIAFSIDGATQETASRVRPGTDLERVIENIKQFVRISRKEREISTAVFSAVSAETVESLDRLIDLVSALGVHVLMLTDLNFTENVSRTLWKNVDQGMREQVRSAVAAAFKKDLPVLSVRGLEEFGLWKRYGKYLLLPPDQLHQRSLRRAWCCSPWQTVPVNVQGEVTLCDCQPGLSAGNLFEQPLSEIWNGRVFLDHRERMLSDEPPAACSICPRF